MYLKKIIIAGFKSFADKVVITLDKGITGIVGPNGSGKSNVIDAVRWVMGEQNAKNLRGEKATDIIFAGSERRKPLGMAEVSLVFDNSDDSAFCPPEYRHESEITLCRRLYADGQREYLINKKPCRLKDIIGFFSSTGLGGRSYSMIQQGQVDRILNAKPEDVREILEEAAGTMVFKRRKAEAERKLEQTNYNLKRIEDILAEVDKSLEALGSQVEKAREYQELTDQLRREELSLLAHNFHHFQEQQRLLRQEQEEAQAKEAHTLAEIAHLESRHAELQAQLDDSDPEIQALQERLTLLREQIARNEAALKSAGERLEYGARRQIAITEELAEDDANLKVLEGQLENARQELGKAEAAAADLHASIESFAFEVEAAAEAAQVYQSRIEEFADESRNLERLIESNRFRVEQADKEIEKIRTASGEEERRVATLTAELAAMDGELQGARERAGATQAGLDQEIRDKHGREAAITQRTQTIKDANARRDQLREKYHAAKARYTSLVELDGGSTDVGSALAAIKEQAPEARALLQGLLTDYLAFGANAAELPPKATAAFERWAERLLVADLNSFNELVRVAHRLNLGSLAVTVLSQVAALEAHIDAGAVSRWAEASGALPMVEFIGVDEQRAPPTVRALLNRLYLLPALSLAPDEIRGLPAGIIVFTAQGVCVSTHDDFIIGGKSVPGLLSRKTELDDLAAKLKVLESDLGRTQAEIDELEMHQHEDRQVVAAIDAKLQAQNRDVLAVMSALQALEQMQARKQELIDAAASAQAKHQEQAQRLAQERASLVRTGEDLQRELTTANAELASIQEESESLLERQEETRRLQESRKVELARAGARAQALRDSFITSKSQLELVQNKLSRRYEDRHRLDQDMASARHEQAQAQLEIEQCILDREKLQSEFSARREASASVIEETRVIDGRLRIAREVQGSMRQTAADKGIQLERLRMAIAGVGEQAMEKYKIALDQHEFTVDASFNHDAKTRSVSRLRNRLEGMGAINMMALKEYDERSERRTFIARQRDEVNSSIELLTSAIAEIEETSLRKFLAIFATINEEFGKLFPILFPTGEGKLELTTPENPMGGGVEILCRLPGKSQKPMSLFSGGEKALTAMALIFALLRTKPTPYCFLDEVDAPLDEANVGRYNRVLEALADQFQFIVITHNRRTMEVLDILYGVTMQEPGVSKVVGVDMQKDLPPHLRKAFKETKVEGGGAPAGAPALTKDASARPIAGASVS